MFSKNSSAIDNPGISKAAANISFAASAASLVFLAALHVLSPEFDPSLRMVSEYALGSYSWVLSLMFIAWALSSWALAFAIRAQVRTVGGKIGLAFLVVAGLGEAMAAIFAINHPLHGLAAFIGIPTLPIAAMLISASLGHIQSLSNVKKNLLLTANFTWVSLVLMAVTFILLIITYPQTGVATTPGVVSELPPVVIALVGWANRLLIVAYCVWVMTVARYTTNILFKDNTNEIQKEK